MQLVLDKYVVEKLQAKAGKRRTITDLMVKGLSLELRPSGEGSWRYRFTCDSKQECLSLGLLSKTGVDEARMLALQISQRVARGENPVRTTRAQVCPKFAEFIEEHYLPYIKTYKRCVTADITLLENHLLPAFGGLRLSEITRQHVLRFQSEKMEQGYKPAYCNRFLVLLSYCFNLAIKWEMPSVDKNPVKLVSLLKANNKIERFLTPEETGRLLLAIQQSPNPMLKYFVTLALLTGMRKREILDAKWQDIDLDRKLWLIPHSKSGYSRHVPLTDSVIAILQELRSKTPSLMEQKEFLENPWIVPNWRTGKPFKSIFNAWDSARKKAQLHDLRIHDLRHSFASALVNQGVPIYDVQKLLGHQDVKTTQRYAHFSLERLRSSASVMNDFYPIQLAGV